MRSARSLAFFASLLAVFVTDADGVTMTKLSPIGVDSTIRQFGRSLLATQGEIYIGGVQQVGPASLELPSTGVVWQGYDGVNPPQRVIGTTDLQAYLGGRTESFGAKMVASRNGLVVNQYNNASDGEVWFVPYDEAQPQFELAPPDEMRASLDGAGYGFSIAASTDQRSRIVVGAPFLSSEAQNQGGLVFWSRDPDEGDEARLLTLEAVARQQVGRAMVYLDRVPVVTWVGDDSPHSTASSTVLGWPPLTKAIESPPFSPNADLQLDVGVISQPGRSDLVLIVGSSVDNVVSVHDMLRDAAVLHVWRAKENETNFGQAVATNARYALVSADAVLQSGSVGVVYAFDIATGLQLARLQAPPGDVSGDRSFGDSLSIDWPYSLIGAPGVDNGVGAAYLVDLDQFYLPGDFNGDQRIDNADLNLLLGHWGAVAEAVSAEWDGRPVEGLTVDNSELAELMEC